MPTAMSFQTFACQMLVACFAIHTCRERILSTVQLSNSSASFLVIENSLCR